MKSRAITLTLTLLSLVFAGGCRGKDGSDGATGPAGPQGPLGPGDAPFVLTVAPGLASSATILRVTGLGFAIDPASNVVTLDGAPLEVLSATATELRVTGLPAVEAAVGAELAVSVGGRPSNGITVTLAPAGTERAIVSGGLREPRALALDADGASVVVFDRLGGILRLDASGMLAVVQPLSASLTGPTAGLVVTNGLLAGDGDRIVHIAADGAITARVSGLAAAPTGLAQDATGAIYWVDGSGTIGKQDASGVVTSPFATVAAARSIARLGANLYVSDPVAGKIDRIALSNGAVTAGFVTRAGVNGLATDGVDLLAFVPDVSGASVVRVTEAGVVSNEAAVHPVSGLASPAGLVVSGVVWSASANDGGLERFVSGTWHLRAASAFRDATDASWTADRLYLAADNRCPGGGGALFESLGGGASRLVVEDVCSRATLAELPGAVLAGDTRDGKVTKVDGTGAVTIPVAAGADGATALAAAADGSFFRALDAGTSWTVVRHDASGAVLTADVFAGAPLSGPVVGMAFGTTELYVAQADRVHVVPLDALGAPGTPDTVVQGLGLSSIRALGADGDGNALILDGNDVLRVAPWGGVTWVGANAGATAVHGTPYGEILLLHSGTNPIARLQ